MPDVLSPKQWGAQIDYDTWNDPYTPDDGVALHHGGGANYPAGVFPHFSQAKEMELLRSWENYHLSKGWRGLAYGWAVGQTGTIYRARAFNTYGAHTGDLDGDGISNNKEIIPIVFLGSGLHHKLSPSAQNSIDWLRRYVIEPKAPKARFLYGHQELKGTATTCPGPNLMAYVNAHRTLSQPPPIPSDDWTKELIMALPTLKKTDGFKSGRTYLKPDVKRAQGLLLANGHKDKNTSSPEDATDGLFGSGTETATKGFQKAEGLEVDGIIGQTTWTALLGE